MCLWDRPRMGFPNDTAVWFERGKEKVDLSSGVWIFYCPWEKNVTRPFITLVCYSISFSCSSEEHRIVFCSHNRGTSVSSWKFYRAEAGKNPFQIISQLTKSYDFVSLQEGGFSAIESIRLFKSDNTEEINWHSADDWLSLPSLLVTQVTFKVVSPKHLRDSYKNCELIRRIKI